MLRVLHTSDWHLGHQLHDFPREAEHEAFLAWLLVQIAERHVDALLIAGDVFHTANPSSAATGQWHGFLAAASKRFPSLDIVAIAGNHDSAGRIEASQPLLPARHTIIGRTRKDDQGALDLERMLVPLHGPDEQVAAWVLAVPFLRPQDLPPDRSTHGAEYQIQGTRRVYEDLLAAARSRASETQAVLAMGHMHMVKAAVSDGSERRVFGGAEHVPADIFAADLSYVALGHLHKPQKVGGQARLRYCGSPIPLSMDEEKYPHQVVLVELEGTELGQIESLRVPRSVQVMRIPGDGPAPDSAVLPLLAELPDDDGTASSRWPYLEVRVLLDKPSPTLRRTVEEALAGKAVRLVRIAVSYPASDGSAAVHETTRDLSELEPGELFTKLWTKTHGGSPDEPVMSAFHELVDEAQQRAGESS